MITSQREVSVKPLVLKFVEIQKMITLLVAFVNERVRIENTDTVDDCSSHRNMQTALQDKN